MYATATKAPWTNQPPAAFVSAVDAYLANPGKQTATVLRARADAFLYSGMISRSTRDCWFDLTAGIMNHR